MKFLSLQPFVPSGNDLEGAKKLFVELGFRINWDAGSYIGFQKDECRFILQEFNDRSFAENFMISVAVDDVDAFWKEVKEKQLVERLGIHLGEPTDQAYGREVNIIDLAGVCWHFVQG